MNEIKAPTEAKRREDGFNEVNERWSEDDFSAEYNGMSFSEAWPSETRTTERKGNGVRVKCNVCIIFINWVL